MSKRVALLFIVILTVSSLLVVESVPALASISTPSVPEFTLKFVDHSYDVPPTYGIDPYTGKNVMTQAGYPVQNKSIEVTIKNQPFTPYIDVGGERVWLFYDVRFKGYFEDWGFYNASSFGDYQHYILMSDSEYTLISYFLQEDADDYSGYVIGDVPSGGQIDFQVQAIAGYVTTIHGGFVPPFGYTGYDVFTGEKSGWSSTQTITISESQTPTSSPVTTSPPDQTPEPTPKAIETIQFETILSAIIAVTMIGAGLGLLIYYFIKRKS
jgi:hypothetical protein